MSGPVSPPLATTESGTTVRVQPTNTLEFNGADFTVTGSGSKATISIDSTGTGAALTDTHIGFGSAANLLTGSANFTFTEDTGSGPVVLLTGDNPKIDIQDDTAATDYKTRLTQSGASLFVSHSDSTGTNREVIRVSNSYVFFNDDGLDIDVKMEGENVDNLFRLDAAQDNIGIATAPDSDALLHIKDDGSKAATVRVESTDTDADVGPVLELKRNPGETAAVNDDVGKLTWIGPGGDGSGTPKDYSQIITEIQGITSGSEHSRLMFKTLVSGTMKEFMRASASGVEINAFSDNIDFKIEGDSTGRINFYSDASNDNIGIGTSSPNSNTVLHITDDGSKSNTVRIESTDNDAAVGPVLDIRRNNADGSATTGDTLGSIQFTGLDSGGGAETYNRFVAEIKDADTTQAIGRMKFLGLDDGSELEYMRYESGAVVFNELGVNIDFRVEGQNDDSLFRTDASDDSVGIGSVPDTNTAKLQVTDDGTKSYTLLLESTDPDANQGPVLALWRNSPSPASGDDIGAILFAGENDGGARVNFARIRADMDDVTAGGEDCSINFQLDKVGTLRNNFRIRHSEVVVNEDSVDTNFRVESDGNTNMFMVDAGLNRVSVGASPTSGGATLQVPDNTISHYANVQAVRSDSVATQVFVNEDLQGQLWVLESTTNWNFDLPESPVKGMHFRFVSTSGNITVDPNPSGGTSNTINGGTGALTRSANNEIYECVCIAANTWIMNLPV